MNTPKNTREIDSLAPASYNPRKITPRELNELKKSLEIFGDLGGIVFNVRTKNLVGGHQRIEAFKKIDSKGKIMEEKRFDKPNEQGTVFIGYIMIAGERHSYREVDWSLEQEREANIRANANGGQWDQKKILEHFSFKELKGFGVRMSDMKVKEVHFMASQKEKEEEEEIPEIPSEAKTKKGDLYKLGNHRLLCGDSTEKKSFEKLLKNDKCDLVFTSPPYNSGNADFTYDYNAKKEGGFYRDFKDDMSKEQYFAFCISVLQNCLDSMNEKHSVFWNVMYNANSRDDYGKIIFSEKNPLRVRETIIWNKGHGFPVANDNIISRRCELIFLLSNSEKYLTNQKKNDIYWNLWEVSTNKSQDKKNKITACFPEELVTKAVCDFSEEGMILLDPFGGSGTSLISCERTVRKCRMIELDPKYCDVIVQRWEDFTGEKAELLTKSK